MLVKILNFLKVINCYKYVYYGMMLFLVIIILCSGVFKFKLIYKNRL